MRAIEVGELLGQSDASLVAKLVTVWDRFDDTQLAQFKSLSSTKLDAVVKEISVTDLAALSTAVQSKVGVAQKVAERLKSITLQDVASWADEQWDRVPVDNLVSFSWGVLQKVPITELGKWSKEQWVKIPVDKLVRFTGAQIAKIDAATLASLGGKYWDEVPVYHIVHFGVEVLQSAGVLEKLNATQVAYMTASMWKSVPVESILKFTTEKLQAIDYEALGAWTKEMWDKVPIDTLAALVDQQIQAVPPEVAGAWAQEQWLKFPTEQAVMFTGEQLKAGAKVLKDMTEEQLAQYDWSQMSADALSQLPPELQDKIRKLSKYVTNFKPAEFKQQLASLATARRLKIAKLQALQLVNDNPLASSTLRAEAQKAYNAAVVAVEKLSGDMQAVSKKMYTMPPVPGISAPAPTTINGCQCLSDCKILISFALVISSFLSWMYDDTFRMYL